METPTNNLVQKLIYALVPNIHDVCFVRVRVDLVLQTGAGQKIVKLIVKSDHGTVRTFHGSFFHFELET